MSDNRISFLEQIESKDEVYEEVLRLSQGEAIVEIYQIAGEHFIKMHDLFNCDGLVSFPAQSNPQGIVFQSYFKRVSERKGKHSKRPVYKVTANLNNEVIHAELINAKTKSPIKPQHFVKLLTR